MLTFIAILIVLYLLWGTMTGTKEGYHTHFHNQPYYYHFPAWNWKYNHSKYPFYTPCHKFWSPWVNRHQYIDYSWY
jgi:hypothetical protein